MAHPHNEHRQHKVEKSRAHHLLRGYKHGGAVKSAAIGKEALSLHAKEHAALHAEGHGSKHRMDRPKRARGGKCKADGGQVKSPVPMTSGPGRFSALERVGQGYQPPPPKQRAKGGRVGKHKGNARTIVNVITGGHPAGGAMPPPPPIGIAGPPPGAMPAPPMAAKPPMPMPPPGAGMPPGGSPMPMRKKGGRVRHRDDGGEVYEKDDNSVSSPQTTASGATVAAGMRRNPNAGISADGKVHGFAKGGRVSGRGSKVWEEGVHAGTQVQHSDGHATANKNLGRGKPVTFKSGGRVRSFYAHGGRVESPKGIAKDTRLPGGSGGGEARLVKAKRAAREYHGPA